jgi:pimeloyl-ACP methyl ester carboxylesterase
MDGRRGEGLDSRDCVMRACVSDGSGMSQDLLIGQRETGLVTMRLAVVVLCMILAVLASMAGSARADSGGIGAEPVYYGSASPDTPTAFTQSGTVVNPGSQWGAPDAFVVAGAAGDHVLLYKSDGTVSEATVGQANTVPVTAPVMDPINCRHPTGFYDGCYSLDPTGTKVAYIGSDGQIDISNLNAPFGTRSLGAVTQNAVHPVWSPDGNWIAFSTVGSTPTPAVSIISPDGSKLGGTSGPIVVDSGGQTAEYSWFPNSRKLAEISISQVPAGDTRTGAPGLIGHSFLTDVSIVDFTNPKAVTVTPLKLGYNTETTGNVLANSPWSNFYPAKVAVSPSGTSLAVESAYNECSKPVINAFPDFKPGVLYCGADGNTDAFGDPETNYDSQTITSVLAVVPAAAGRFSPSSAVERLGTFCGGYVSNATTVTDCAGQAPPSPPNVGVGFTSPLTWLQRSRLPVVLVTGLRDSHGGVMPDGDCAGAGSMATLCQALKDSGFPVYVPSSSADPAANTVITNSKGFDSNALNLKDYLTTAVGRPALLVGHSMGGIFSRMAIAFGARAAGLFTIGSPFDGSFAADLAVDAATFPCTGIACTALRVAGASALLTFGPEAMRDLTRKARERENLNLSPHGVKTWTFAGTACHPYGATGAGNYLFPNDGVVGKSSAYGVGANLGPTMRSSGDDYHQELLGTLLAPVCGSGAVELSDQSIVNQVLAAANQLDSEKGSASLDRSARAGIASAKHKQVVVYLQTATVRLVKPGSKLSLDAGTSLLARTEFALNCDGRKVLALPALGDQVFGFTQGALSCRRATLSARRSLRIGIATDPVHVTATIVSPQTNKLTITVSASRAITRLVLSRSGHALRLKQRRLSRRALLLRLTPAQAAGLILTATIQHRQYTATIG